MCRVPVSQRKELHQILNPLIRYDGLTRVLWYSVLKQTFPGATQFRGHCTFRKSFRELGKLKIENSLQFCSIQIFLTCWPFSSLAALIDVNLGILDSFQFSCRFIYNTYKMCLYYPWESVKSYESEYCLMDLCFIIDILISKWNNFFCILVFVQTKILLHRFQLWRFCFAIIPKTTGSIFLFIYLTSSFPNWILP